MRFLHSLLYSLAVWIFAVVAGSLVGVLNTQFLMEGHRWGIFDAGLDMFMLMLVYSAVFSLPAPVIVFLVVLVLNPRSPRRALPIKLALTVVGLVVGSVCVWFFMRQQLEEWDTLLLVIGYPAMAVLGAWIYPVKVIAARRVPTVSGAGETVSSLPHDAEEKRWFETQGSQQ